MNPYLQKLHSLRSGKGPTSATLETLKTRSTTASSSFEGFEGGRDRDFCAPLLGDSRIAGDAPARENDQLSNRRKSQNPFDRALEVLSSRCPDLVPVDRWQLAVDDARAFLAHWGEQAQALGWTTKDLFGLLTVPQHAKPTFNRLSRYDETGLIWLLEGRRVVALTESTAAIESPASGSVTMYRRHNKPALGPLGDSLEDFTEGLR